MKKYLILLLSIVCLAVVGCGQKNTEEVTVSLSEGSEESTEEAKEFVDNSSKFLYVNDELSLPAYEFANDFAGEIVDIAMSQYSDIYILTDDNSVYKGSYADGSYEFFVALDSNFESFAHEKMGCGSLVINNIDGSYTIYDGEDVNNNYTFESDNLICAYYAYNLLHIISFADDMTLQVTDYNDGVETVQKIVVDETNAYLDSSNVYSGTYTNCYGVDGAWNIVAEKEDGTCYAINLASRHSEDEYVTYYTDANYGYVENATMTKLNSTIAYYFTDTEDILYKRDGLIDIEIYEIELPEGYIKDNVDEIYATDSVLLVMDDGNIYSYSENEWTELTEVSGLLNESHVIKFTEGYLGNTVLCDDGCLYLVKD